MKGWVNVVFLHFHFFCLCYSYYKTIVTNPGNVEKNWVPDATKEALEMALVKDERRGAGRNKIVYLGEFYNPRYCHHCKQYKPPRSHHCKDCQTCVLKMDHHCPWVNNCVGYYNHKYFMLFLYYATVSLTYFLICCAVKFYYTLQLLPRSAAFPHVVSDFVLLLIHFVLTLPVTLGIASLLVYQLNNLRRNLTSIETYIERHYKYAARRAGMKTWIWFYDWGTKNNYRQMFGERFLGWFIPNIPKHVIDGDGKAWKGRVYDVVEIKVTPNILPNKDKAD